MGMLGLCAALVYIQASIRLFKDGFHDQTALIASGIVFGFAHIFLIHLWWVAYYKVPEWQEYMFGHPAILFNVWVGIMGALFHIRAATKRRYKEYGWTALTIATLGISYLLVF